MAAPHDVPTAAQLVEAVREWIEKDLMTASDPRTKFHARVAANAGVCHVLGPSTPTIA